MKSQLLITCFCISAAIDTVAQTTEVFGTVIFKGDGETAIGASVMAISNERKQSVLTDFDGHYTMKLAVVQLDDSVAKWRLVVGYPGYKTDTSDVIEFDSFQRARVNFQLARLPILDNAMAALKSAQNDTTSSTQGRRLRPVETTLYICDDCNFPTLSRGISRSAWEFHSPTFRDWTQVNSVTTFNSKQIEKLPTRNLLDVASLAPGVYQRQSGSGLHVGGGRVENTLFIVDGIMVTNY